MQIFADTLQALNVFVAMGTQWRVGMSGATGLDYAVLPSVLRLLEVPRKQWRDLFDDLRVMEESALEQIHRKQ